MLKVDPAAHTDPFMTMVSLGYPGMFHWHVCTYVIKMR